MVQVADRLHPSVFAERRPDEPAYIMARSGEVVTWSELETRTRQASQLFRSLGLEAGDGIALLLDNHPRFLEICWAAQRSGLYFTPMSWHFTASEADYIVRDSGAKLFLASAAFEAVASEVGMGVGDGVTLLSVDDAFGAFGSYEEARDEHPAEPISDESFGDDMLYTSGTTGRPKGVRRPLDGRPIDHYPQSYLYYASAGYREGAVHLAPGPLYHASPLHTSMVAQTFGGTVVVSDRFEPETTLAWIEKYQVSHSNWVPTHFVRLLRLAEDVRSSYDLSSLELVLHGAAACPAWVKEAMIDWVGPILTEYYGGSEGFGACLIDSDEWLAHRGSVGRPLTGGVHIVDEASMEEVPVGEVGMIYFETHAEMTYHNDPDKTKSVRTPEGWATLGDMGSVDADGYVYLADRRADLIITGGVNVYPREVEDRLLSHPGVVDVAVYGTPDDEYGEIVHAVIEPREKENDRELLEKELRLHAAKALSKVKCPRAYEFVESLPRRENGKLYKRLLRDSVGGSSSPFQPTQSTQ